MKTISLGSTVLVLLGWDLEHLKATTPTDFNLCLHTKLIVRIKIAVLPIRMTYLMHRRVQYFHQGLVTLCFELLRYLYWVAIKSLLDKVSCNELMTELLEQFIFSDWLGFWPGPSLVFQYFSVKSLIADRISGHITICGKYKF